MKKVRETRIYRLYKNINEIEQQEHKISELINKVDSINSKLDLLITDIDKIKKNSNELCFATIFNDSIKDSWLDIPLSLSSGAIGYPFAYILFRILNDINPKKILETGLGQSTKIITEYVKSNKNIRHDVVEHDKNWIEFFKRGTPLKDCQNIHLLSNYKKKYSGIELNAYKGFKKEFEGMKFDFISIDGPVGHNQEYSRMDILDILPECLEKSFVILLDDAERIGEHRTIIMIEEALRKNNISFNVSYLYSGINTVYICVSEDLEFLCHI